METKYVPVIKLFRRDEKNFRIHNRMTDIPRKSILSDIHDFSGRRRSTLVTRDNRAWTKLRHKKDKIHQGFKIHRSISLEQSKIYLFYGDEINDKGRKL